MTAVIPERARIDYEDAPLRWFHLRVAVGASGGEFSEGFGLGIIGICLNQAAPQLNLNPVWLGGLGAASLASLFAGALLTGALADRIGRRPVFGFNMAVLGVLSLMQGLVHTRGELLALRLAIGFVLGSDYAVNKAMLIEYTPRRVRGRILGLLSLMWAAGYSTAYFAGFVLSERGPESWRWMLMASAIPCFAVLPIRASVPETPMWLTLNGRSEEAARIVRDRIGAAVTPPLATARQEARGTWSELFSPAWRRRTVVACVFFTCLVIPYFAVGTFVSEVMSALNTQSGYLGGLIYNFSLLGGAALGLLIVDRVSRRTFLIGSFWLVGCATLALTLWSPMPLAVMMTLFAVFAGVLSAASNLVYVYLPELFPTTLRASGIGLASAVSRIGSAVSTFLLPLVVATYGVQVALEACAAVLVIGAILCQMWAPETRDLRLENLDQTP
ncbi:MAG: MFS transporter [Proteobacteria bacterium]|nr:MFS transporter [Pseudomonadota bacterium]